MLKKLSSCIREYKKDTILTPILIVFEVILEVLIPYIMVHMIDFGIDEGNMQVVIKTGIILLFTAFFSLLFGVLSGKHAAHASAGFAKNVRKDMYHHIQDFSFSNIDTFSSAGLITRLTTDVTNVQNAFQMLIRIAFRAPVMMVLSLVMAFRINKSLSFIFIIFIPILALGIWGIMTNVHPIIGRVFKRYDNLNTVVQENLHGVRVVKSYVREEHEKKKFGTVSSEIYKDFVKADKLVALNSPLMMFCMYGCTLLISWFGAKMIVSGNLTTGELVSLITYIMQILSSLMMCSMVFLMVVISKASAIRICEVLDEESNLISKEDGVKTVPDGSITFEDVSFSYVDDLNKLCLRDVDFSIQSGETVGIIGGTGSSKTTLVQLIPRLYDATKGVVKVGGNDVKEYELNALREQVAMVLQKNELFSGTIKENLRWGNPVATDEELIHAAKLSQADEFVQSFPDGYDTYIEQGGTNVSGGQKQRLCIARALLKKPKILILDDSTSAVDTKTDALIQNAFLNEIPEVTKIIIAQRISSIECADKIIVLDNGMIDAIGTHQELMEQCGIYQEVYESQNHAGMEESHEAQI